MMTLAVRCLLGATALFIIAGLANRLMGRKWAASQRHAVWTVALLLSAALPLLLSWEPPVSAVIAPMARAVEIPRFLVVVTPGDAQPIPWRELTRWVWLAGVGAVGAWWLMGFVRVTGMVASSREHSTFRGVAVRTCCGLRMPAVAAGPVILLPESAGGWPRQRLDMVLTHEQAHVQRWDLLWRLVGTVGCCMYWFHPLAWWAAAQQRRESEMACDDYVVMNNGAPAEYADSLVAVAREAAGHATPAAVMAMAKPRELEGRLLAVLDGTRRRGGAGWMTALASAVLGVALVTPLAAWQDSGVQMKGAVRDIVGVIPGAKLVLTGVSGGASYSFETGADGTYAISGVPEGEYNLEILKAGYQRFAGGHVKLIASRTARADHFLQLGSVRETMVVDGGAGGSGVQAAPEQPKRIRVSGNVQAAKIVKQVRPIYPAAAKEARIQGLVRMSAIIGKEGNVQALTLLSSPSTELARAAMDAVNQWVYAPTLLNGAPVEIQSMIDVNFTLTQ